MSTINFGFEITALFLFGPIWSLFGLFRSNLGVGVMSKTFFGTYKVYGFHGWLVGWLAGLVGGCVAGLVEDIYSHLSPQLKLGFGLGLSLAIKK